MSTASPGDTGEGMKRVMPELERGMAARIQMLEQEIRRLRRLWMATVVGLAVLLGLITALVVVTASHGLPGTVADVVEAKQFLVRDANGAVRGAWGALSDGSLRFTLQSPGSKAGVSVAVLSGGASGITFTDSAGRSRGVLALLPDETMSLTFGDRAGRTRSALGLNPEGSATLVFADRSGAMRAGLGVDSRGTGTFTLRDRLGALLGGAAQIEQAQDQDTMPAAEPLPVRAKSAKPNR